jgi:hypothetical protein
MTASASSNVRKGPAKALRSSRPTTKLCTRSLRQNLSKSRRPTVIIAHLRPCHCPAHRALLTSGRLRPGSMRVFPLGLSKGRCWACARRSGREALPLVSRGGRPATEGCVKPVDERGDNLPWPEMVEPLTRVCLQCGAEYSRRRANGRLREPRRWRRALYCSRLCAAQHRGRWKALPLAGLDLPPPPPKPKLRAAMPGRPSRKTGREAIERVERIAHHGAASFRDDVQADRRRRGGQ